MPSHRPRRRLAVLATAALLGSGALTGCGADDEPAGAPASESASPSTEPTEETTSAAPTPTPTPTPSESASATPTETASPAATPAATPEAALLTAEEMPGLNDTTAWKAGRTGAISVKPFGSCQKFDLLTIGAVSAVERTFTADGDQAGQQVAEFPDAMNASRAAKVVESWRKDCRARVRGQDVKVGAFASVPVATGTGSWYLLSYERRGQGGFDSLGMVVSGPRLTLLRMTHQGQDHNYPQGQDPMQLAVEAAAAKLG